jgi:hypothetical protein
MVKPIKTLIVQESDVFDDPEVRDELKPIKTPIVNCKLVGQRAIEPASATRGYPCDLCLQLGVMREAIVKMNKEYEHSDAMKSYNRALAILRELEKTHIKCAGCGLCFGGLHIATKMQTVPALGPVCQYCAKEIEKYGLSEFLKRVNRDTAK